MPLPTSVPGKARLPQDDAAVLRRYAPVLRVIAEARKRTKIEEFYRDSGPYPRALYSKHLAFFEAGSTHRERLFLAGNRVGKTEGVGAYELTLHLTGAYPEWWTGRRFTNAVKAWAGGDTSKTVREIIQDKLVGPPGYIGTGMIPAASIVKVTRQTGVADTIDSVWVRHSSGQNSVLVFKSYEQGREAWQGTEQDVVWMDEEPPQDVYAEALMRTMTTNGLVMLTFTPLRGLSEVVLQFLPGGRVDPQSSRYVVTATWDDAPHLTEAAKRELWAGLPPYQRDARSKGIPALGSGAIYPIAEQDVRVDDFSIPPHYPRVFGLDSGWNNTAVVWLALDRETGVAYLYSAYKRGQAEPAIHAEAVKSRGAWIPGAGDAADISKLDGRSFLQIYRDLGLKLDLADKAVETGLHDVWQRLSSGKLKVFRSLSQWFEEFRLYRRDERGRIVKENDHLMDATRYAVRGLARASVAPVHRPQAPPVRVTAWS